MSKTKLNRRLCVAPMMAWTDRHDRYMLRLIAPSALLYTEMVTTGALIYGKRYAQLAFNPQEHPLALQLGGSDPKDLAFCAKLGQEHGFDEINLNCGCPSDRVQKGAFGACLMAQPDLVADCVDSMLQATDLPVTVKTRIGIDDQDSYGFLTDFIGKIAEKGCKTFIIHARKALLKGLSPAENRTIPPLKWETAYQLKKDFPDLEIILNGGIRDLDSFDDILKNVDGIMIGREAYQNPWFMALAEQKMFGTTPKHDRFAVAEEMILYIERLQANENVALKDITRHMHGLFQGLRGARNWRRILSEQSHLPQADSSVVRTALKAVSG